MSLVSCKECGKEVSNKAAACPSCGFKPKRTSRVTWLVTIFVAVPLLIAIVNGGGERGTSVSPQAESPEQDAAKRQKRLEREAAERKRELDDQRASYARIIAEKEISKQLKAPSTADFSGYSGTKVMNLTDLG